MKNRVGRKDELRSAATAAMEPGADRQHAQQAGGVPDQVPKHLSLRATGLARWWGAVSGVAAPLQATQAALRSGTARPPARQAHDRRTPRGIETRQEVGHWEIDTVMGASYEKPCIVTLVERASGYVLIGRLPNRTTKALNQRTIGLMQATQAPFLTITSDNGTEFHGYPHIEAATGTTVDFARPPSSVGARHQREYGRPDPPVPAEGEHEATDPTTVQRHCPHAQHPTEKAIWI